MMYMMFINILLSAFLLVAASNMAAVVFYIPTTLPSPRLLSAIQDELRAKANDRALGRTIRNTELGANATGA